MSVSEQDFPIVKYAICKRIEEHTSDVRVVKAARFPTTGFLSGSRDTLTKLWIPDGEESYKDAHVFMGTTKFVSSVCSLSPSAQYPNGLILTGSHDGNIYGFILGCTEPLLKLQGHTNAVCSLAAGMGFFVSGSWDNTARIWRNDTCIMVLQGHGMAVWATEVYPAENTVITGSADCTIRVWQNGICQNVFYGHEDAVRGLAITRKQNILSCSNDTTVRMWNLVGECLHVYNGHTSFIYSITLLSNGVDFATCGEDEVINIWKDGKCVQSLVLPGKKGHYELWSITCLKNGDLAVGCSDGAVYILRKIVEYQSTGDDTLNQGDTKNKMALEDDEQSNKELARIHGYVWSPRRRKWVKKYPGLKQLDVKELSKELNQKKPTKEKDLEFFLEIDDCLHKLEMDIHEDEFDIAKKFILQNGLNCSHLEEILNHIKNHTSKLPPALNEFFPLDNYYVYTNVNVDGLRAKLLEFSDRVPKSQQISRSNIEKLVLVANLPDSVTEDQMQALDTVMAWSDEYLFPALDLLRLAVRCNGVGKRISNSGFIAHLLRILKTTERSVNRVLVIKVLCNLFGFEEGEKLLIVEQGKVCEIVKETLFLGDDKTHKSSASLFFNYAVAVTKGLPLDLDSYCTNIMEMLRVVTDSDSLYKLFVAIGTICMKNYTAFVSFNSLNIHDALLECQQNVVEVGNTHAVLKILLESFEE